MADLDSADAKLSFLKKWGFQELRPHSQKKLPWDMVWHLMGTESSRIGRTAPAEDFMKLINRTTEPSTRNMNDARPYDNYNWRPSPVDSDYYGRPNDMLRPENRKFERKLMRLPKGEEDSITYQLNNALLGEGQFGAPIVETLVAAAAGYFMGGAIGTGTSLLFAGNNMLQTASRVLARHGDELYHVEEIGYIHDRIGVLILHVNAIFLVDPYRNMDASAKAWLIHEDRKTVNLDWNRLKTPAEMHETLDELRQVCTYPSDQEALLDQYLDRSW